MCAVIIDEFMMLDNLENIDLDQLKSTEKDMVRRFVLN